MTIRALCLSLGVAAAVAAPAFAYVEAELDRVTAPIASRIVQRLAPLAADADRTPAEERELRALTHVWLRIRNPSGILRDEFLELEAAAAGLRGVPDDSGVIGGALTAALGRADEQIALRRGWVEDHVAVLPEGRGRRAVERLLAEAAKLEARAAAKTRADRRATLLRRAERLLTAALVAADAEADRLDVERPPPRVRNGAIVGAAGGRIVFPDDGSPLAGVDVTQPPGAVDSSMQFLVEAIDWTWAWPEAPVAQVLRISQGAATLDPLPRPLVVSFRYDLAHAGDPTLGVTPGWQGSPAVPGAVFGADGRVTVEVPRFGVVAARRILPPPPHPEFPAERYHVVLAFGRSTSGTGSTAESLDGVAEQDFTFGPGPTGSTADGTLATVERRWVAAAPRHEDTARTATEAAGPITWSLDRNGPWYSPGRFTLSFPLDGDTLTGSGDFSRDGRVVVFSARGATTVATAIGVRDDAGASSADFEEPWFVGARTIRHEGSGSADFAEHRSIGVVRHLPDGAGGLAAVPEETLRSASVRFRTDLDPVEFSAAAGTESMDGLGAAALGGDGRLVADGGRTTGWVHSAAGILVARRFDASDRSSSLLVGVRDDGGDFEDLYVRDIYLSDPPSYATLTFAAETSVVWPGTASQSVVSQWRSTAGFWSRYTVSSHDVYPGLALYGWMEQHRAALTLRVPDPGAEWPAAAEVTPGWNQPNQYENGISTLSTDPPSPRRVADSGAIVIVPSPDGEALLSLFHGGIGLGVRTRR